MNDESKLPDLGMPGATQDIDMPARYAEFRRFTMEEIDALEAPDAMRICEARTASQNGRERLSAALLTMAVAVHTARSLPDLMVAKTIVETSLPKISPMIMSIIMDSARRDPDFMSWVHTKGFGDLFKE